MPIDSARGFLQKLQSDSDFRFNLVQATRAQGHTGRPKFIKDAGFDFSAEGLAGEKFPRRLVTAKHSRSEEFAMFPSLLARVSTMMTLIFLVSCKSAPAPHPAPPPPPPVPKPCARDTCISLLTLNSSPSNVCQTADDPNNRSIYVDFPKYRGLKAPATFIYERVQTDESGNQIGAAKRGFTVLGYADDPKWLFCSAERDASKKKLINWVSRLCATNREGASTTDCSSYSVTERWPVDDKWIPSGLVAAAGRAVPKAKAALNCPTICSQPGGLCRTIQTKDSINWTQYNSAIDSLSKPASYPMGVDTLDNLLGANFASANRTDSLRLEGDQLVQEGPQVRITYEGVVNGTPTSLTYQLPNRLRAKYLVKADVLSLDFDDAASRARIDFSDAAMTSLYGGAIRATWFRKDGWLFATDKRCLAVTRGQP